MSRIRGKNRGGSRLLKVILSVLLLAALMVLGNFFLESWQQRAREKRIEELARQQTEAPVPEVKVETETLEAEPKPYVSPIDFEALRQVNPDVVAWVTIPGTVIDYPVVQTDDNETYLKKTFEGGESAAGAIYLDCDSDSDFMGMHSILYGHHMRNGSMFAELVKFKDEDFFKEHREIILYTPERELHLRTIAALYGDADGEKRRTKFDTDERFQQYADDMTKKCIFRELPEHVEGLYSFVTCSYEFDNARTIVYAVREPETAEE